MTQIACPHCNAPNVPEPTRISFCTSCGRAVPAAMPPGPRVVSGPYTPSSSAGKNVLSEQLTKELKRAAIALLIVAILQTIFGPVMLWHAKEQAERANPGMVYYIKPIGWAMVFGIAAAFWILYAWARINPLPAAIVGLVLFITLHLVDAISDPNTIAKGLYMKIAVVAILGQAINSGIKARKLKQS